MPLGPFGPSGNVQPPTGATHLTASISALTGYAPPTGALAFLLQTSSTANTTNVRWRVGGAAAVGVGHQLEPGRDSGIVPWSGSTLSLIPESGTCEVQLTWFIA